MKGKALTHQGRPIRFEPPFGCLVPAALCLLLFIVSSAHAKKKTPQQVLDQVAPALVRLQYTTGARSGFTHGWIVSQRGHVLVGNPHWMKPGVAVRARFPDGTSIVMRPLGWSNEFRVGMLQLTGKRKWPVVRLAKKAATERDSSSCVGVGFERGGLLSATTKPRTFAGEVQLWNYAGWATANFSRWAFGNGVFNTRGELIGVVTHQAAPFFRQRKPKPPFRPVAVFTTVDVIHQLSLRLQTGGDLDKKRVRGLKLSGYRASGDRSSTPSETQIKSAIRRAVAASVRVRRTGTVDPNWGSSGVIVDKDGSIVSCGHHFLLPGDKVTVSLSNKREVQGVVLGTNWVTDISILKILDKPPAGGWSFAELGNSWQLKTGDACLTVGYPAERGRRGFKERKVSVHQTKIGATSQTVRIASVGSRISGESGGGIFDMAGRVLGIGESVSQGETLHVRSEIIKQQWMVLSQRPVRRDRSK